LEIHIIPCCVSVQLDLGIGGEMDEGEREGMREEGMASDQLLEEN